MIPGSLRSPGRKAARGDAEKPFWISYADLMTALMVLFLVALTVALLAITHEVSEAERQKKARDDDLQTFLLRLRVITERFPGLSLRGAAVDFGERARFETNSHRLNEAQMRLLREFVPQVLELARDPLGEKWLKRISVEGFADARGSYLHNLNLSLQRSQRVLCALLAPPGAPQALSDADRRSVHELFLVSGASFNALKNSPEESRRIELRLEFLEAGEAHPPSPAVNVEQDSRCPLDV